MNIPYIFSPSIHWYLYIHIDAISLGGGVTNKPFNSAANLLMDSLPPRHALSRHIRLIQADWVIQNHHHTSTQSPSAALQIPLNTHRGIRGVCVFCLSLIDAQIDVQNVPVDTTKEHHNIRALLTFQSGCVPDKGVTILRQHHLSP